MTNQPEYVEPEPLPEVVCCTMDELESFARRIPSPAVSEELERNHTTFSELCSTDAGKARYAAWRLLKRDYPNHDSVSLWLHSYYVEVEVREVDPTSASSSTDSPGSAPSTTASPTTSTA